jgi:Mce-associated membrane protein
VRIFTTNVILSVAAVLAVLTFGYAAYFGVAWYAASHSSESEYASNRDEALRSGQVAITNFTTLDYRKVDEDLQRWLNSSTGELRAQIDTEKDKRKKQLVDAKSVTESKVLDAALTELDDRTGKAKMIAVVEYSVTPEGGQKATKIDRFLTELTRTEDGWKLSQLGQMRVGI